MPIDMPYPVERVEAVEDISDIQLPVNGNFNITVIAAIRFAAFAPYHYG